MKPQLDSKSTTDLGRVVVASLLALAVAVGGFGTATRALAHPHVWVGVETTVRYENGAITALEQVWTFDELYAAMAIEGLDANGDGVYERGELAELAKAQIDGLKELGYFTVVKLSTMNLAFADSKEYWLEHKNGVLSFHFVLPLEQPVLAEAEGFSFSVSDPSYFIAFDLAKTDPVKLADGAPQGCKAAIDAPPDAGAATDTLSQSPGDMVGGVFTFVVPKTVTVSCPKT